MVQHGSTWSKKVETNPDWSKIPKLSKLYKVVSTWFEFSNGVQNGLNWS